MNVYEFLHTISDEQLICISLIRGDVYGEGHYIHRLIYLMHQYNNYIVGLMVYTVILAY